MKNIKLSLFEAEKIGASVQLNAIKGGGTYVQSGSGSNSGGTYRDFRGDGGNSNQCGVADNKLPTDVD
jgi:hypothetical protein